MTDRSMASGWRRIWFNESGLRSGWKILIFGLLFAFLIILFGLIVGRKASEGGFYELLQWLPVLAAAIVAGWVLLEAVDRRPRGALGFSWTRSSIREIGIGLAIGVLSLGVVALAFILAGWVSYQPQSGTAGEYLSTLVWGLSFFLVAAATEEAIFRGYPFQALVQGIGAVPATLLASLAFALAHLRNPNIDPLAFLNIFLAGVMLSAAYLRTRSLWFATAVHLGWNWSMASLFDLPVSGRLEPDTPLYEPVITGPEWMTGGAFGPEGGIGGSIALLIAAIAVIYLPGLGPAPENTAARPLVDDR